MMLLRYSLILIAVSALAASGVLAQRLGDDRPTYETTTCFHNLDIDSSPLPLVIPIGCDAVDCCPGCAPGPIDWVVRASGLGDVTLALAFEGLDERVAERLAARGDARWLRPGVLAVEEGTQRIEGIGHTDDRTAPLAIPHLALVDSVVEDFRAGAANTTPGKLATSNVQLEVTQMLGPVVVARTAVDAVISECLAPPVQFDTDFINIDGNGGAQQALIWLDARVQEVGCENDLPVCLTESTAIPNIRSGCSKEAVAFSPGDGMVWKLADWSDGTGNVLNITFPDMLNIPLKIWIMKPPFASMRTSAELDVLRANQLFNSEDCGIRFSASFHDVTSDSDAIAIQAATKNVSCSNLQSDIGFDEDVVNVYYFSRADMEHNYKGFACPDDSNGCGEASEPVLMVNHGRSNPETLAHEIGHLFALMHTKCYPPEVEADLSTTNLMESPGINRNFITAAQCFRMNADELSWINLGGFRAGPTRKCVQQAGIGNPDDPDFVPVVDNPSCPVITNDIRYDASIPSAIPPGFVAHPCEIPTEFAP